ncbi:MAG: HAMP domain-containing protein [Porphyrobacter sp.]|nr:HAMP domain-containing protein [Porphyrobacter sp.]
MSQMMPVPQARTSERLRGLAVLSPRERLMGGLSERLSTPWRYARHSLAARFSFGALGVSALLVVLGIAVGLAMVKLSDRIELGNVLSDASQASSDVTESISEARYHAARFATTGDKAEINEAHRTLTSAKDRFVKSLNDPRMANQPVRGAMQFVVNDVESFDKDLTVLEHSIPASGPTPTSTALATATEINGEQLMVELRGVAANIGRASTSSDEALSKLIRQTATTVIALLLLCIVVSLVGAGLVVRTTAGSIRQITRAMSGLAEGDRETAVPGTRRLDEIGEMARALEVFRKSADDLAHFQELAAQSAREELARQEADHARQAELMRELAQRFELTVGEVVGGVATASEQLQQTAGAMAAAAKQSAELSGEVSRSMASTSSGVTAAASASDQFALSIGEISRQAANSAALAQDARSAAGNADETIAGLASAVEQIEEIVALIDKIAKRTDLLALNASIEAARSGVAGRGFAVVAGEVKDLAGQTSSATRNVAEQIRAIQAATGQSVAALRQIGEQVRTLEGSAITIAQAVDEQTLASNDLARNLTMAASGADAIGHSLGHVSEMAQSTGAAASQVLDSAGELHRQAAVLKAQVNEFLGYVRGS